MNRGTEKRDKMEIVSDACQYFSLFACEYPGDQMDRVLSCVDGLFLLQAKV